MNEREKIEIKSLLLDLSNQSSADIIAQTLEELKKSGYNKVTIDIKTSTEQELKKSGLDIGIFGKIKEVQELPDWVVINFMLAAGKLNGSNYKIRY